MVQGRNHPAAVTRPPSFFDLSSRLNATNARGNSRTRGCSFSAPFYPIGYYSSGVSNNDDIHLRLKEI